MEERLRKFYEVLSTYKKTGIIKDCFHHRKSECKGHIKQSHSIQRNGRLSLLEGEVNGNMCLYTFTSMIPDDKHLLSDLKPIGKKDASTFFGFCDYHDSRLFSDIENNKFDNSDKHLFLHSYRSYAHSYHRKHEEYKAYHDDASPYIKIFPKWELDTRRKGTEIAIRDSISRKNQLDTYLDVEKFDGLEYLVYEKEGLFPFAVSSQMSPKVSYKNKPMNNHADIDIPYSQPIITFLPDQSSTFVILAAFRDDLKAVNLLDELNQLTNYNLEIAITSLIIANCENTFFAPAFWNCLTKKEKRLFLNEFESASYNLINYKKFFRSRFNFFDSRFESKKLGLI